MLLNHFLCVCVCARKHVLAITISTCSPSNNTYVDLHQSTQIIHIDIVYTSRAQTKYILYSPGGLLCIMRANSIVCVCVCVICFCARYSIEMRAREMCRNSRIRWDCRIFGMHIYNVLWKESRTGAADGGDGQKEHTYGGRRRDICRFNLMFVFAIGWRV